MKLLKQGLCLGLTAVGLSVVPVLSAQAGAPSAAPDQSVVDQIRAEATSSVRLSRAPATGKVDLVRVNGAQADLMPGTAAASESAAARKADAYLQKYSTAFGAAAGELTQTEVSQDNFGWTVRYVQRYRGVEVFASMIKANVDADGDLSSVTGYAAPDLDLSTTPRLSAAEAGARAVAAVKADPAQGADGKADTTGIKAVNTRLVVYRMGAIRGVAGEAVLAYQSEVTNQQNIRDMVIVDAATSKVVNRYSMVNDALDRELYEASGTPEAPVVTKVWEEGNAFPGSLNTDQQNLVNSSGESYWLFANAFGRDSYDGAGATMKTVNNDPRISCPNANWNGVTTNYCNGVTSDDVVSHEWAHAYTEYTSGLIYQYQSGALNESYSDVWGETLDLINGREDEGEAFASVRTNDDCDPTASPKLEFTINTPAAVAGPCTARAAAFGPAFTTAPVTADVVVSADAADATGPSPTDGCTAFSNSSAVAGKWAYVDRGTCTFQLKVDNATAAGAKGIVVGNNQPGLPPSIAGTSTLYGVAVSQSDGAKFKSAGTANVTVQAEDISTRPATTRWLVGEKSEAFGGAIRDMWNPTCYGNPGKVSDAEYNCDFAMTDNGGVHGNSGVPNHAYALLVDGGTFNGTTVAGIGLDKAANIWFRAQTAYLTPSSNFVAAADAFEASCADLTGLPINKLSTTTDATPVVADPITAADCTAVTAAVTATEMRTPPVQCDFQPLLDPDSPALCGEGFDTDVVWSEDFEDGLVDWDSSSQVVYPGASGAPWTATSELPGDHDGAAAYGTAPDRGSCDGSATDFSSRDSIASSVITMPAGKLTGQRLSFDHYVATEAGFDGGNVKYRASGQQKWKVIPASAYIFNAPTRLSTAAEGNTNPLAGEEGFTGTDGGEVTGSWGQSQVDLAALKVTSGKFQLRFDIGRDGCGGIDGWYVDDITVTVCTVARPARSGVTPGRQG